MSNKSNFDFYGYTLKYCIPNVSIGKLTKKAKIYYNCEYVCDYNYDYKSKKITLRYPNHAVESAVLDNINFLHDKYLTPNNPISFIMRMFDYFEIYNHQKRAKQNNLDGIYAIMDKNLAFQYIIPVKSWNKSFDKFVVNKFKDFKCYFLKSNKNKFISENIF